MKLCISTLACPTWNLDQIVKACVASGIGGIDFRGLGEQIDITLLPQFNEGLDQTLQLFKHHSLAMPCLNTSVTLVTPAPERWQMMLDECRRYAQLADRSKTPFIRVFGGGFSDDMTRDEARSLARRHLRQLVQICRPLHCIPLLEIHDAWVSSDAVLELLEGFDPAEAGILWDFQNTYHAGEATAQAYAAMDRYIRHIHFKDCVRVNGVVEPRLLGEGDVPLRECYQTLRDGGFDGWFCLECEKRWHDNAPDPEVSIPQFAQYMHQLDPTA